MIPGRASQNLQRGQGMAEYVIALVAVAVVSIAIVGTIGSRVNALFGGADAEIESLTSGDLGGSGGGWSPDEGSSGAQPSGGGNDGSAGSGDDGITAPDDGGSSGGGPNGSAGRGDGRSTSASSSVAARGSGFDRSRNGSGAGSGRLEASSRGVDDEGDGLASGATGASGNGDSRDATDLTHKRSDEEVDDRSLSGNPPMGEELEEGDPVINMLVSGIVGLVLLALAVIVRFTMAGGHR